jgi:hypothetical protein
MADRVLVAKGAALLTLALLCHSGVLVIGAWPAISEYGLAL